MAEAYATVQDLIDLWRPMSADEQTRAENLLPVVSDALRYKAHIVHKDMDEMIAEDTSGALASTVKLVIVNAIARTLNTPSSGDAAAMSQVSQSGLGYTFSGTFAAGGRQNYFLKNELADLGLRRQAFGCINMMPGGDD